MKMFFFERWLLNLLEENVKRTSDEFFEIRRVKDAFDKVEIFYQNMDKLEKILKRKDD